MRRWLLILLTALLCGGCAALPAEERSFAVALGVSGGEGAWLVTARIPTYQTGGGYATVSGEGAALPEALAALDAACPMEMHLGQLRLLVISADTARSGGLPAVLTALTQRQDMRPGTALAVTQADVVALMDALKPPAGERLSKAIDVLLRTRIAQGTIPDASLAATLLMGERQQPVLINAGLQGEEVHFSGGWPVGADGGLHGMLDAQEMQLLALVTGRLRSGTLSLEEGTVRLISADAQAELSLPTLQQTAVRLRLRCDASPMTQEALSHAVATASLGLLNRLSAMGCDALGLARQAIPHAEDAEGWREMDWPSRYREMDWSVSVGIDGPTQ